MILMDNKLSIISCDNGLWTSTVDLVGFNVCTIPEQKRAHKDQSANLS